MFRRISIVLLVSLSTCVGPAVAQAPAQTPPAPTKGPARTPPPTRDPNTPGYVKARELPDGGNAPIQEDGNFILGPTHNPAPEMTVQEGVPQGEIINFTMESKDSKFYPGITRDQGTFGTPDSDNPVKLTKEPEARATMGGSSGGSAALIMAWYHPEWYHRVLTYSGTYVNQQYPWNPETPGGAWDFHERLIPNSPKKPIRIWMHVSDRDNYNPNVMRDNMHDWVLANEKMAQALAGKGYH